MLFFNIIFQKNQYVYFASHFHNVYEVSPIEEVEEYLEDMALLGFNHFQLTTGTAAKIKGSPETLNDLARRKRLWKFAISLGMKISHGVSNQGYSDSPQEIRAEYSGHSFFGTEICPNKPEGMEYLLKKYREEFEALKDVDIADIKFWPYDQGGCGCEKCYPYGVNGMFTYAEKMIPLIKEYWPDAKIMWSTWEFDYREYKGEWEELYKKLQSPEGKFIELILADSHDNFPEHPLKNPLPENVSLVTFPEISMWGRAPWGGYGATPLPKRFSKLFGEVAHVADGGILYSEGIFEDFNKALYANFFATGKNDTEEMIREYARYDLGLPESALPEFKHLLELMEDNHEGLIWFEKQEGPAGMFDIMKNKPIWAQKGKTWNGTGEMLALVKKLDDQLPAWAKKCWRWRLFYLRAVIDFELAHNDNETNDVTEKAMLELVEMYRVSPVTASRRVTPFTDEWIKHHVEAKYIVNVKSLGVD